MKRIVALLGLLFAASCLSSQTTPNLEVGYTLFGSFHGSDIDQVNLNNRKLEMRIPLLSYPQRGGKLHVGFSIHYSSPVYTETKNCYPIGAGGTNVCADIWDWSDLPHVEVVPDFGMSVGGAVITNYGGQLVTTTVTSFDGSVHQMGNLDNSFNQTNGYRPSLWESSDGSKIRLQEFADKTLVITDSDGTRYPGSGQSMEDSNGNQVTWGANGYLDTVGRSIPLPPRTDGFYPTFNGNSALCTGALPIVGAAAWTVPSFQGTATFTFCYVKINIDPPLPGPQPPPNFPDSRTPAGPYLLLQSIVLPQQPGQAAQAYTFQYDTSSGWADLTQITLPSGGTISYGWNEFRGCHFPPGDELDLMSRAIGTRTVNDGASSHQWQYVGGDTIVGSTNQTSNVVTITDPLGNNEVHTFSNLAGCSFYETEMDSYSGTQTLLKSVQTQYYSLPDPNFTGVGTPGVINVLPKQVLTQWASGATTLVEKRYDGGFTLYGIHGTTTATPYGSLKNEIEHDFGSGTAGPVIRQDSTTFQWEVNPSYSGYNLMDIPYQQQVLDGSGNVAAQTTYLYDGSTSLGAAPSAPASSGMGLAQELDLSPVNSFYRGNPTSITRYLNTGPMPPTLNTWYDTGEIKVSTDPGNHSTTYTYDTAHGAFLTQTCLPTTNGVAHCTEGSYDTNTGLLTSFIDQNNQQTTYGYDTLLRLTSVSFPDLGGRTYTYTDGPNPKVDISEIMDSTNNITSTVQFDGLGRKIQNRLTSDPDGIDHTDTTYDALGRVASVSNPYRSTSDPTYGITRYAYDALGRTTTVTRQDGNTVTTSYVNFPTTIINDESGHQRQSTADALGRLLQGVEPNPATGSLTAGSYATNYSYDALGNLTLVQQGGLANRSFTYDSLSRLTSANNPESGITGYVYDADSEVTQRTRPQPNQTNSSVLLTTNYTYDFLHRKTGVTYTNDPAATPSQTFNYDETSGWGGAPLVNTTGRMTTMYAGGIPGIAASMFSYDPNGRVKQNWQCTPRTCGTSAYYFPYTYDKAGDLISDSNGVTATFTQTYNAAGRLTAMSSNYTPDGNHPSTLLSGAHYAPFGLTSDTLGNGLNETYSYHQRGWLQNATFGGTTAAYATGAVQYSGSEQLHNATDGTGSVTVGFSEPAADQVQNTAATQATGSVSISGSEGVAKRISCGTGCYYSEYDAGYIDVYVNGVLAGEADWGQGSSTSTIATSLATSINGNSSSPVIVSPLPTSNVLNLITKASGAAANYSLSATATDDDPPNFPTPHFSAGVSGPNLTGGQDATYTTYYDNGQASLCINGNCGYRYNWNQNDSANTVASGLASAVQADTGRLVNASASSATITLSAIALGSVGNYSLSASSTYDSAHFGGPAASFSVSGMGGGTDGVPDTGSATLTVAGLTKTHNWAAGDTAANIAVDLANQLNADGTRQANATTSSCGTNCTQINLTATTQGPDPSYNGGISHSNPSGYFPNSSFSASPSGVSAMSGGAAGSPSLYSYALSFAPDGDITSANDSVNGNWTYTYDQLNRLATSNKNAGQQAFSYSYDQYGNRWSQTVTAGVGPQPSFSFTGGNNRMDGYSYDAAGNMLNDGSHNYVYDAENRIACVDPVTARTCGNGATATYVYDAEGRRVKAGSYEHLYDLEGRSIALLDAATGAWDYGEIYAGGRHLATYSGGTTVFDHSDWLGTERMRTSPAGAIAETCSGLPFGDGLSCTGTDYSFRHFTGKERDSESGLDHFKYRNYANSMARWTSPDPSQLPFANLGDPQSLNLYIYVGNNPINRVDLDGLCWKGFQWACNLGQRFDNLVHGEGFHTDKGVEDIAHRHNAEHRQQEVNGTSRAYSLGVTLGRWARTRDEFYRKMMCYPLCDMQVFGGTGWGEIDQFLKPRLPLRVVHNEPPLQTSASYKEWNRKSTQEIIDSLAPGNPDQELTVYPDGSIANGNTRITILQERGVDVNSLPRVDRIPEPIIDPMDTKIPE